VCVCLKPCGIFTNYFKKEGPGGSQRG